MSNFLIFKAAFNNSATPAIGTYTAEGATAQFNKNTSISPDYYLYNTMAGSAVQWFVPTAEATDFEFVADILTRNWTNKVTYFIIADNTGTTRLRMWSVYDNWCFENSDSTSTSGDPEYIGVVSPTTSGGFGVFHQFRIRVRKLTESSSSVEIYVDGTLKLTATAGAALVTCAKIGFVGGVGTFGPGTDAGVKNAYVYDLSGGDVIDRGVLSGAFNRFISWMKSKFALKSDIPTVNDATLTIQQNGTDVQTFTANQSTNATANIQCVDLTSAQTVAGNKTFSGTTETHDVVPATTDTYDLGSSAKEYNNAYIKALTINGTAAGDILTHNASEFVPRSGGAVLTGISFFKSTSNNQLQISSGTSTITGGCLVMYGSEYSNAELAGAFRLRARTTTNYDLIGYANGVLEWNGTSIVPKSDNSCNLGSSNCDFANVYTKIVKTRQTTDSLSLNTNNGASIILRGKQQSGETGLFIIYAYDGTNEKHIEGKPDGTLSWDGSPITYTSDRRIKDEIKSIPDEILDAWENLEPKQYKLKSDLETDKENAQTHYGWIAQDVESVIKGDRKGEVKNGLWLHEQWEEQEEVSHEETYTEEVETKSGETETVTKTRKVIDTPYKAKGDSYGLRYTECLVVECKYLRRCIARLTARIEQLEKGNKVEEK